MHTEFNLSSPVFSWTSLVLNSSSCAFGFNFAGSNLKPVDYYRSVSVFNSKYWKRLQRSPITVQCSNPQPPNSKWGNYSSRIRPFSVLVPVMKKLKDFAVKASKYRWVSVLQGRSDVESMPSGFEEELLQNGTFGMALLSVTSTAKVKFSPFVATIAANPTFVSGLFALALAQSFKVFLNFWFERKWDLRIMFASGGMPSSHSALCTAMTTSVALCHGVADSLFPVCLGFSLIVMYDAIGVRRHAGMQAEVLNVIVKDLFQGHPLSQRKLKELLGHTPSQVVAGAFLGIVVACICCQSCTIGL